MVIKIQSEDLVYRSQDHMKWCKTPEYNKPAAHKQWTKQEFRPILGLNEESSYPDNTDRASTCQISICWQVMLPRHSRPQLPPFNSISKLHNLLIQWYGLIKISSHNHKKHQTYTYVYEWVYMLIYVCWCVCLYVCIMYDRLAANSNEHTRPLMQKTIPVQDM